jgi:ATP-dependent helicase/DNAse subunit B
MAEVRVICGTERSGRSARIDEAVRERWGRALLLVPTRQYAARRVERIIFEGNLDGAWGRPVMTLDDFAEVLLREAGKNPIRLRDTERRMLLDRSLETLRRDGKLKALGDAADTRGFRSHVLRVITQLKQGAIEPKVFRERVRGRRHHSALDDVVAEVYSTYQDSLLEAGVYDLPGLFWEAEFICRQGRPKAVAEIDLLALDGFDDFTPSEFRLLTSLSSHVQALVFGLNYDPGPNRVDLYKTTERTYAELRSKFDPLVRLEDEDAPRSFLAFASSNIFWRDEPKLAPKLDPDLEIVPCADFVQEIEAIGRRVKSLITDDGVPAEEIAVVFRNLREAAGTVRSVFAEFGIPVHIVQQPSIWESAVFAFLMDLFDTVETWAREPVLNMLTSVWFSPAWTRECASWPQYRDSFPLLSRMAQVISGLDEWRTGIERLLSRRDEDAVRRLRRSLREPEEAARALLKGIETIEQAGTLLPAKASASAYAAALDEIIDMLGVAEAVASHPVEPIRGFEHEAMRSLRELLGECRLWDDPDSPAQSRKDFLSSFREAAQETTFAPPASKGGVACLDVESARLMRFDHVFFGGANEGEAPRPATASAIYSEEDLAGLADVGIVIEGRRAHSEREALMFHHVLNVPRKRLCVTWRMLSRQGKEQYPSPYVTDLINLFPNRTIQDPFPKPQQFVPRMEQAASWRDVRNAAFLFSVPPSGMFPEQFGRARMGAEIERMRHDRKPFGVYDGVLAAADVVSGIALELDESHVFSVNQIEKYKACPFGFFVERILGVEEAAVPAAEFDASVRGAILHDVLQAFHEQYRGLAVPDILQPEALDAIRAHVEAIFKSKAWKSATAPRGVEDVELRRMVAVLERYLRIEFERNEPQWKPTHFEVGFGRTPGATQDPLTRAEPYALLTPSGAALFAGRIDRIDVCDAGARIIDYKSGAIPGRKEIREGASLQLAVYALAVEEFLMPGTACREAHFLQVGREGHTEALGRTQKKDEWPDRQTRVREVVAECIAGMRAGRFPPTAEENACRYCTACHVCRYERSRIERKEPRS